MFASFSFEIFVNRTKIDHAEVSTNENEMFKFFSKIRKTKVEKCCHFGLSFHFHYKTCDVENHRQRLILTSMTIYSIDFMYFSYAWTLYVCVSLSFTQSMCWTFCFRSYFLCFCTHMYVPLSCLILNRERKKKTI